MNNQLLCFLIDDDIDDQEIFNQALEIIDIDVVCVMANDGVDALEKINKNPSFVPDVIFVDMNMPRMNGLQCLENIKRINRFENVTLIIYSTSVDQKIIAQMQLLGIREFIEKPSNFNVLTAKLTQVFEELKLK